MVSDLPHNAFLRSLPPSTFASLSDNLKGVDLPLGETLLREREQAEWVYFPETALLSMVSGTADGQQVETAMAGSEGVLGLLEACGSGVSSVTSLVQVDGRAWRSPAAHCRKLTRVDDAFAASAWRLVELQMAESRQSALCQALHPVEQRFARWMLESSDRSGGRNPLPMTQEFLAAMLGVQRTTVSAFAAQLQREGLVRYSRGRIELVDLAGLELRACECRSVTREERARLRLT